MVQNGTGRDFFPIVPFYRALEIPNEILGISNWLLGELFTEIIESFRIWLSHFVYVDVYLEFYSCLNVKWVILNDFST